MTWTRLSDDFADDCGTLSDQAFRLHVEGLCWSARKLLDCAIPISHLPKFATHPEAVVELVDVGWWTRTPSVFLIRHHAGYQRTRAAIIAQQEANSINGRRGGRPRKGTGAPREIVETHSLSDSLSDSKSERDGTGRERTHLGTSNYSNADPATEPGMSW